MQIKNLKSQKDLRRALRKNQTPSERKIWYKLNRNQLGVRFLRQYGIGQYVVDFCCPRKKLIIEIDGDIHGLENRIEKDASRTSYLENLGYKIIRFTNRDTIEHIDNVLDEIYRILNS